jgi:ribosome-binding protein aMBF1 (putative translation factor)
MGYDSMGRNVSRRTSSGRKRLTLSMTEPISDAARVLGERVREHRQSLRLSQEAMADQIGIHWTFLGQVERGQRNLNLHNLLKLARGLDVDPAELVKGLRPPDGTSPR